MPPADKKAPLPNLKLSQNIRKAIERNIGCEEDLIRTLQDVNIKKRAALNEITLKKDAFLRQQRRRRESLPDVLSRNSTNQPLVFARRARDDLSTDLECSTKAQLFPSCDKTTAQRIGKLPSLPRITTESGENDNVSCEVSDSQDAGIKSKEKQLREPDSVHLTDDRKNVSEKVLGVQSWPPSPSVHLGKSILSRRKSMADAGQANSGEPTGQPTWLRRQTLHHIFHSTTTPRAPSENQANASVSDPFLMETSIDVSLGDPTLSRYRKVLNRRRSLQTGTFNQPFCPVERLGANRGGERNSKSLEECHVLPSTNKTQRFRRVPFQDFCTEITEI